MKYYYYESVNFSGTNGYYTIECNEDTNGKFMLTRKWNGGFSDSELFNTLQEAKNRLVDLLCMCEVKTP